jgi:UDP-glucose 4-epimerase
MNILITGGTGFIGSHTAVELLLLGHTVTIVDNLSNSTAETVKRIEKITEKNFRFEELDIRDTSKLVLLMESAGTELVIHFAALKSVGDSVQQPATYYDNNVGGTISLLKAMKDAKVNKLLFSSSATVYGDPDSCPITEDALLKPATNPYGATKQMCERIIEDTCRSSDLSAVMLRYFNPIGAHPSGFIGELPQGTPNNLVPYVTQAAAGVREALTVFGDDYDTPDGSGVRDYIHVVDLAKAHVAAVDYLSKSKDPVSYFNIGTGSGVSVLEIIKTFEKVTGVKVPYQIGPRRPGDIATCYADASKAEKLLGWKAEKSLEDSLIDAWRWQKNII